MAIGAARVMAAGKAGLESLPFFVDELMAQGIPQLVPWAADHSHDQITVLHNRIRERVQGSWKNLFEIGSTSPGIIMVPGTDSNQRLLRLENPLAAEATELADSPAQLGAWCRREIDAHCRRTQQMWERYKAREGLTSSSHLAVIVPFCPEGPTSGTVGMYLGAALRKHFDQIGKSGELVVWGIELCPPPQVDDSEQLGPQAVENLFRGYVARGELIDGVPLSDEANDTERHKAFDINIVFDGGTATSATEDYPVVCQALDRAAAQATACLLNGAGAGDQAEAVFRLKQGKRWNAYLTHVVSELDYEQAARYLKYQVTLPWHRDREAWGAASVRERLGAFLHRIDNDIAPRIKHEQNEVVKKQFEDLIAVANEIRAIPLAGRWNDFLTKNRAKSLEQVDERLAGAVRDDEHNYRDAVESRQAQDKDGIIARSDLLCINLALPENQRRKAAINQRDNDNPEPLADILGDAGIVAVQDLLTDLCKGVLKHYDCKPDRDNSDAFFDEVASISVVTGAMRSNEGFRPTREQLSYYIAADRRRTPGVFNESRFDPTEFIQAARSDDGNRPVSPTLKWQPSGVDYDVPVEYSILTLARVRDGEGFKDISTYERLLDNYEQITADPKSWREKARYYGVKPPPELLADLPEPPPGAAPNVNGSESPPDTPPSVNGQEARVAAGGLAV